MTSNRRFAIANADMMEFLRANGVEPQVASEPCRPLVRAQQPPQQQQPETPDPDAQNTPEQEGQNTPEGGGDEQTPTPIPLPQQDQ